MKVDVERLLRVGWGAVHPWRCLIRQQNDKSDDVPTAKPHILSSDQWSWSQGKLCPDIAGKLLVDWRTSKALLNNNWDLDSSNLLLINNTCYELIINFSQYPSMLNPKKRENTNIEVWRMVSCAKHALIISNVTFVNLGIHRRAVSCPGHS